MRNLFSEISLGNAFVDDFHLYLVTPISLKLNSSWNFQPADEMAALRSIMKPSSMLVEYIYLQFLLQY